MTVDQAPARATGGLDTRTRPRNRLPRPARTLLLRVVPFVMLAGGWELWARQLDSLTVPTFTEIVAAVVELVQEGETWAALWVSNQALLLGFAASVVVGVPVGLLMGRLRRMERILDPWVDVSLVVPSAVLIPILIMAIGFDLRARVAMVVVFTIPMIVVNSRAGVREVPRDLLEMATAFGASERQLWQKVLVPSASPAIWAGLRIGLGRAITGMVIVELLMVAVGIGNLLLESRGIFESGRVFGMVVLVVAEALLLISLVEFLERRLTPWTRPRG